MKQRRIYPATEQQMTATAARAALRAFATACDKCDPVVFAAAGVSMETFEHLARAERWMRTYMNAVLVKS